MEALSNYAPFLTSYGPVIGALIAGYIAATYINTGRQRRDVTDARARSDATSVTSERRKVHTSPRVTGSPQDEDNYVLLEDTVVDVASKADSDQPQNEADYDYDLENIDDVSRVPFEHVSYADDVMLERSAGFYRNMNNRRSVRMFSDRVVPLEIIENIIRTAGTSPSGAHTEPWTFVVVKDPDIKAHVRDIVEDEERVNYERRMGEKWVSDLKKLSTDWEKSYLERAPYVIIVFKQAYGVTPDGQKKTHYYSEISISISAGLMLAAIQNAGLVTVTSTPMNSGPRLRTLLNRPDNEKVILLLPIGYPADDATVPDLTRKPLEDIMVIV